MANQGPLSRSLHFHHASAFGVAGQIDRPEKQTIPTQAAIALAPTGGKGSHRVENYRVPGVLSFSAAYVEVGGSLDERNDAHTTYASSVIENLNICDVVTADRVVSRLTIYLPAKPEGTGNKSEKPAKSKRKSKSDSRIEEFNPEPSFSISGSHFKNLRVAGHQIDIKLAAGTFQKYDTYSKFANAADAGDWLVGTNIDIDDRLMRQAMRSSGARTKRAVVEEGLRLLIQTKGQAAIRRLRGKVGWQGDLNSSRVERVK